MKWTQMSKVKKLIYGVGINDAGYQVSTYSMVDGRMKRLWRCPMYRAWTGMLDRCYSKVYLSGAPTYRECSVSPEWHSFSAFRAWMVTQDHEGKQLDKDILAPGNKVYTGESCVFVSGALNTFLTDCGASRGEWPIGVCLDKSCGKFKAGCRNPFSKKLEHLGYFTCPDAAHSAWRARKHQHACAYADAQDDPRIAAALRARYSANEGRS